MGCLGLEIGTELEKEQPQIKDTRAVYSMCQHIIAHEQQVRKRLLLMKFETIKANKGNLMKSPDKRGHFETLASCAAAKCNETQTFKNGASEKHRSCHREVLFTEIAFETSSKEIVRLPPRHSWRVISGR